VSRLIPRAKGVKISYKDIEQFPDKPTELLSGNFLLSRNENKLILLAYTRNFGLEFFVNAFPPESIKELKRSVR
jgi:hypothetical protein